MTSRPAPFPLLTRGALVVLIVMLPIEVGAVLDEAPGLADGYGRLVVLHPFDLALMVVGILGLPLAIDRLKKRNLGWGVGVLGVLLVGASVATLFNPSVRAAAIVARLAALTVVAAYIGSLTQRERDRLVVIPLMITVGIQSAIGIGQVWTGEPVGLGTFGEREAKYFYGFGGLLAAQGTTIHGYVLAGFSMLATTLGVASSTRVGASTKWLFGIAICAIPLGLTYSRMALIGMALVLAALIWGIRSHPDRYLVPTAVVVVAIAVPAMFAIDGWTGRELGTNREGLDRLTTGRITLMRQAVTMIEDNPITGVGPGNYVITAESTYDIERAREVHAVPLLIAAEDGAPWGVMVLLVLAGVGLAALRVGPAAAAVFLGFLPFWAFDKFPYVHPNGLVMTAIWLAMLDALVSERTQAPNAQETAAAA